MRGQLWGIDSRPQGPEHMREKSKDQIAQKMVGDGLARLGFGRAQVAPVLHAAPKPRSHWAGALRGYFRATYWRSQPSGFGHMLSGPLARIPNGVGPPVHSEETSASGSSRQRARRARIVSARGWRAIERHPVPAQRRTARAEFEAGGSASRGQRLSSEPCLLHGQACYTAAFECFSFLLRGLPGPHQLR